MINSIFTRHKRIYFQSGAAATTLIYTTTKRSMISVEFVVGVGANSFVEVRSTVSGLAQTKVIYAEWNDRNGEFTTQTGRSHTAVVPSGTTVYVSRSNVNMYLNVFEME